MVTKQVALGIGLTTYLDRTEQDAVTAAVAAITERRALIEQAKGMLILLYGVDDEAAFEMLRARSQNMNIKLRTLAAQLVSDFRALSNGKALPHRSVYDKALITVHERIVGDLPPPARVQVSLASVVGSAVETSARLSP